MDNKLFHACTKDDYKGLVRFLGLDISLAGFHLVRFSEQVGIPGQYGTNTRHTTGDRALLVALNRAQADPEREGFCVFQLPNCSVTTYSGDAALVDFVTPEPVIMDVSFSIPKEYIDAMILVLSQMSRC